MQLFTTAEAASYLRLKERKIYEMVAEGTVPCTKVTGRWLFPKADLDHWLASSITRPDGMTRPEPAPIIGGSHDPLLEWALRESGSGLATLAVGSEAGFNRFTAGETIAAAIHLHALEDPEADANVAAVGRPQRSAGRGDDRLLPPRAGPAAGAGQSAQDPHHRRRDRQTCAHRHAPERRRRAIAAALAAAPGEGRARCA